MTYKEAHNIIMEYLESEGWTLTTFNKRSGKNLKMPYAIRSDGRVRLWFKPQAIHIATSGEYGRAETLEFRDARSTHWDVKRLAREIEEGTLEFSFSKCPSWDQGGFFTS